MISRKRYIENTTRALNRSPVVAVLGPRQCGKTTLAKMIVEKEPQSAYFDLESVPDQRRLENPESLLGSIEGLIVLDEIQERPDLFAALRVMVDKHKEQKFLILGSASPSLIRGVSQSLAGRIEFVELTGFGLDETGSDKWKRLWARGGFPRSFLARSDEDGSAWREGFIRTFLQRDLPQFGIKLSSQAMRRFWTMLAHYHGQVFNASELARAMGVSDKTVRSHLDVLTETYMVRQLQPWHENIRKRQIKSPKIYLRDSGILHRLLAIDDFITLTGHPRVGASWEGFAMEEVIRTAGIEECYFWATHSGAELDLLFFRGGRRFGVEFKFSEAPSITRSVHTAVDVLKVDHLWIVCPGRNKYQASERITVVGLECINDVNLGQSLQQ